jgi:hypothetical protein
MGGLGEFLGNSGLCFGVSVNERDSFVGLEGICTIIEQPRCVVLDDGLGLDVQIAHHCIAVPPAHHLNVVHIDFAAHYCHGFNSAKGPRTYFRCVDPSVMVVHGHGMPQCVSDIFCLDRGSSVSPMIRGNGNRLFRVLGAVILDSPGICLDRATLAIAIQALDYFLVSRAILLCGELVRD